MSDLENTIHREVPNWVKGKEDILTRSISEGSRITEIAQEVGAEYVEVRKYIIASGSYEEWKSFRFFNNTKSSQKKETNTSQQLPKKEREFKNQIGRASC